MSQVAELERGLERRLDEPHVAAHGGICDLCGDLIVGGVDVVARDGDCWVHVKCADEAGEEVHRVDAVAGGD